MLPNFLVIGAAKAGTSSVWDVLKEHPQVFMPEIKETNFFALEGTKPEFKGPGDDLLNGGAITYLESYEKLFEGVTHQRAVGEASTLYMYHPDAPRRIKAYIPHARIVAILRNPIERAFSSYLHLIRDGREMVEDFATALSLETERIAADWEHIWHYKAMGFYYSQLSRYYELFEPSHIKVYLFEDLLADQGAVLSDLMRFLGVEDAKIKLKRLNASSHTRVPRIKCIENIIRGENRVKTMARRFLPADFVSGARALLTSKLELTAAVRRELVEDFREDVVKLEGLIDRDLGSWLAL